MRLLCLFEPMEEVMKYYRQFCLHIFTPTLNTLSELLTAVELNESFEYLPEIWSDLVYIDQTRNTELVKRFIALMAKKKQEHKLQGEYLQAVKDVLEKAETDSKKTFLMKPLKVNGDMTGDMITIALNSEDEECAWSMFQSYYSNRNRLDGEPSEA